MRTNRTTTGAKRPKKPPALPKARKRDREASTRALLEAAIQVFSERGFDAATTREVARRAGVSEALIQRYFEGKEGLLLAIMKHFNDERSEMSFAILPFSATVEEDIARVLAHCCEKHKEMAAFMRVILSRAIVDPTLGRQMGTIIYERRLPALTTRLLHYQQLGQIGEDEDLHALAMGISAIGFSIGFMGPEVFGFDRGRLAEISSSMARFLAHGTNS